MADDLTIVVLQIDQNTRQWRLSRTLSTSLGPHTFVRGMSPEAVISAPGLTSAAKSVVKDVYRTHGVREVTVHDYYVLQAVGVEYVVDWQQVDRAVIQSLQHRCSGQLHVQDVVGLSWIQRIGSWFKPRLVQRPPVDYGVLADFKSADSECPDISAKDVQGRFDDFQLLQEQIDGVRDVGPVDD